MDALGFTGTRATGPRELELKNYLESADMIRYLRQFDTYVTGACNGWDALVGQFLALRFPAPVAQHIVIVPADKSQVNPWWEKFDLGAINVIQMPEGTDYRARNTEIVNRSSTIFYCADYPEDHGKSKRSGTWMTVRIARASDVRCDGIILNS